ncbi:hypothetical protein CB1_002778002 [Camelus ferus]|nr:hypothetical protein CB1_002778002 [Camelus ferus]
MGSWSRQRGVSRATLSPKPTRKRSEALGSAMPKNKGKGGKNRRRGKNENESEKRELVFKEDGQAKINETDTFGPGDDDEIQFDDIGDDDEDIDDEKLKYAIPGDEVKKRCMKDFIRINSKVQTDVTYSIGFTNVISIQETRAHFHLVFDTKGHFAVDCITMEEAKSAANLVN